MNKLFAKAAAALLAFSASGTIAKAQDNGQSADILGLHLGMTPAEVAGAIKANLKGPLNRPYKASITMGSYATPELLLGEDFSEGEVGIYRSEPNKEFLQVVYSFIDNPHVIQISRHLVFDKDTAPLIDDVIKGAIAKYGKPLVINRNGPISVTWNWGGSIKPTQALFHNCETWVSLDQAPFNMVIAHNFNFDSNELRIYPQCGTTMKLSVTPLPGNSLAQVIQFDIGDLAALTASYQSTIKSMSANAAAAKASQDNAAKKNVPKL